MKKLLISLGLMMLTASCSFAYYYAESSSSVDVLKAQGYSESTLIIADKMNKYNSGLYGKYKPVYYKKSADNKYMNAYEKLKNYVDPIQDDGNFFEHQINFTNSWMGDNAPYVHKAKRTNTVENL